MKKIILSLIICASCVITTYAQTGFWTDEGNYTVEWFKPQLNEFHIRNAKELAGVAKVINNGYTFKDQKIILDADIDLSEHHWRPTGMYVENVSVMEFSGVLEGNGHVLKGLNIQVVPGFMANKAVYAGLFGSLVHGVIQDLTIDATSQIVITSGKYLSDTGIYAGGFAASCRNGTFINCVNEADITINKTGMSTMDEPVPCNAGGIAGRCFWDSKIENCSNKGNIKVVIADNDFADNLPATCGGITGDIEDTELISCTNFGDITAVSPSSGAYAGGIFSGDKGKITNCINKGNIVASGDFVTAGGICAYGEGDLYNCVNEGKISAHSVYEMNVGGIVGKFYRPDGRCLISMCQNTGEIVCQATFMMGVSIGGIAGFTENRVLNCRNNGNIVVSDWDHENTSDWCTVDVGGIVGAAESSVMNCYSRGDVSAKTERRECDVTINVGGIVGCKYNDAGIGNNYNTGNVNAESPFDSYAGGITGSISACFLCYYADDIQVSGKNINRNGTSLTPGQMKGTDYDLAQVLNNYAKTLTDANLWEYRTDENGGYPVLTNVPASVSKVSGTKEVVVYGSNGKLVIVASKPGQYPVYDIHGKLVRTLSVAYGENHFELPPGIYIVGIQRVKL